MKIVRYSDNHLNLPNCNVLWLIYTYLDVLTLSYDSIKYKNTLKIIQHIPYA